MIDVLRDTFVIIIFVVLLQIFITFAVKLIQYLLASVIGSRTTWFIMNYITFIGVIHHELCHVLLAFVTGAKILNISMFRPTETRLGSVTYITRGNKVMQSLQNSLSAIAPTVIGTMNCILSYKFLLDKLTEKWQIVIFWYCWLSILIHTPMSKQDTKNAKSGLIITVMILFITVLLLKK